MSEPLDVIRAVDSQNQIDDVLAMPDHISDALFRVESARIPASESNGLVVCGMGGSAIGADLDSRSDYGRSKGRAEAAILSAVPDAIILRPSIIFGAEDSFFNKFAAMARIFPALPLIGGGRTKFQPVYVEDVAQAVAISVEGAVEGGKIYELGGPEVLTFRECMELVLRATSRQRALVSLPFGIASMIGSNWLLTSPRRRSRTADLLRKKRSIRLS